MNFADLIPIYIHCVFSTLQCLIVVSTSACIATLQRSTISTQVECYLSISLVVLKKILQDSLLMCVCVLEIVFAGRTIT